MKHHELQEQIEAYLNGTLPTEQAADFEQQMAGDADLRREVELQRRMQQDYDSGRLKLRSTLQDIMQEPLAPMQHKNNNNKRWLWIALATIVLIATVGIWKWRQTPPAPAAPPTTSPLGSPFTTPPQKPAPKVETPAPKSAAPAAPSPSRPMASNEKAHFAPNRSMEAFVNSGVRSSDKVTVKMISPMKELRVVSDGKGRVDVRFAGTAKWPRDQTPSRLILNFFNNRNSSVPMFDLSIRGKAKADNTLTFDQDQRLKFTPGLYYFTVEEVDKGEVLYAGKIIVDN